MKLHKTNMMREREREWEREREVKYTFMFLHIPSPLSLSHHGWERERRKYRPVALWHVQLKAMCSSPMTAEGDLKLARTTWNKHDEREKEREREREREREAYISAGPSGSMLAIFIGQEPKSDTPPCRLIPKPIVSAVRLTVIVSGWVSMLVAPPLSEGIDPVWREEWGGGGGGRTLSYSQ